MWRLRPARRRGRDRFRRRVRTATDTRITIPDRPTATLRSGPFDERDDTVGGTVGGMQMTPVTSEAVRAVGYDHATRVLRVAFREGGVYDYLDVDEDLYRQMLAPHPWHRLAELVKSHRYRELPS